jgi:thiol-disulfide isomerase/thioredoxin
MMKGLCRVILGGLSLFGIGSFLAPADGLASPALNLPGPAADYQIGITMPSFSDDTVVLGHRFNANFIPKDTVILDGAGKGIFRGEGELPHGMYLVYLPDKSFFDLLVSDDQVFSFENDKPDYLHNMTVKGSAENEAFYDYQLFLAANREKADALQSAMKNAENPADSIALKKQLDKLNAQVQAHIEQEIEKNRDNFFGAFLLALQEVKVPEPPLGEDGKPLDPAFKYKYYKAHYFDNFDVSDVRLLRTPFYEQKVMNYIEKVAFQHPDSLILECDMLINASRSDPQLFRYMLITLFNHFAKSQIMGMDKVYLHIAENYYIPEAEWSDPEFIAKLHERVEKSKPTQIGTKATDIQLVRVNTDHFLGAMEDEELKKNPYVGAFFQLYDVKSKFTILYFWEADCGHCKKATPELYEAYSRLKEKGVEVVAVNTLGGEEGKVKWINYINENGFYDWINAWNPYDFTFKTIYDIASTPQLFVLDEDKEILAKRIAPEQAEKIIETILNNESN